MTREGMAVNCKTCRDMAIDTSAENCLVDNDNSIINFDWYMATKQ